MAPDFLTPGGALAGPLFRRLLERVVGVRELQPGERVGAYAIERELGRGGMAVVYLARRADGEFEQEVALKLLRVEGDPTLVAELFRRERQILARLNHPHIARLLDGGRTPDGLQWFAMEPVFGERIDRHCDVRALPLAARLRLFCQVCEAVQFAHTRLLVHRDLKPSNILVTAEGAVKLLDFGIAELLGDTGTDAPLVRAHTPGYASPEQVRGELVTTASDIWQLGRLLEVILVDAPRAIVPLTATRATQVDSPMLPVRDTSASRLLAASADLRAIVARAKADATAERYSTAAALMDDVQRFLQHQPVRARDAGAFYRMAKFVRRHALGVSLAVLAMIAFVTIGAAFTLRVATERDRATTAADEARASAGFLGDLLTWADPERQRGESTTVAQALVRGAEQVRQDNSLTPAVRAQLEQVIGTAHYNRGEFAAARPLFEDVVSYYHRIGADSDPRLARALRVLAGSLPADAASRTQRRALLDEALAVSRRGNVVDARRIEIRILRDQAALADSAGQVESALALALAARATAQRVLPASDPETIKGSSAICSYMRELDRTTEAIACYRQVRSAYVEAFGEDATNSIAATTSLALALRSEGRLDEAEALLLPAIDRIRRSYGDKHAQYAEMLNALGWLRYSQDRYGEAEGAFGQALAIFEGLRAADDTDSVNSLEGMGLCRYWQKDYAGALALFDRALARDRERGGKGEGENLDRSLLRAQTLVQLGDTKQARPALDDVWRRTDASLPADHSSRVDILKWRGRLERKVGNEAAARGYFERALGLMHKRHAEEDARDLAAELADPAYVY